MVAVTFETFDPTPYQRAPRLNLLKALALGRALLQARPNEAPEVVEKAAAKLERVLDEGDAAVDARRRESVPVDLASELALDALGDALWGVLRNRLEALAGLDRDDLGRLAEGHGKRSAIGRAVAAARDEGARARRLATRLFGTEGLSFTNAQFPEQAQVMASILRVIEQEDLAEEIEALAGAEILALLRGCQPRYEAMVEARMTRDARKAADLGRVRGKVLRGIGRYATAVLTMVDEDEPESLEVVLGALRPIEVLRGRQGGGGREAEGDGEEEAEGAAEAEAEPERASA